MKAKKTNGHNAITVESGVPMPPRPGSVMEGLTAALDTMKVGDSFRLRRGSYNSMRTMASMRKYRMATRADGDGFIRVWRVA